MTVADILETRQMVYFGEKLRALILQRFTSMSAFQTATYGLDKDGRPKGSGSIYPILQGQKWPKDYQLEVVAKGLGVELKILEALLLEARELTSEPYKGIERKVPTKPKKDPEMTDNQLTLSIDRDGLANIKLNVEGLSLSKAMMLIATLTEEGIIKDQSPETEEAEPLRLKHA